MNPKYKKISILFILLALSFFAVVYLQGILLWLALTALLITTVLLIGELITALKKTFILSCLTVLLSIMIVFICGEIILTIVTHTPSITNTIGITNNVQNRLKLADKYNTPLSDETKQAILYRASLLTMPPTWEYQRVTIDAKFRGYRWHNILHIHDENKFRRNHPLPNNESDKFRIIVLGDSMTFGHGVDEHHIYPSLIQKLLEQNYDVEVVNLGRSGWQSKDILNAATMYLPILKPDLVVYGVVLNDFLPSNKGEYSNRGYSFPLPNFFKLHLAQNSKFGSFLSTKYDATLRNAGLRKDFYDDILEDFADYQERFKNDVKMLNNEVIKHKLPPVITMVLDQFPIIDGKGHQITKIAEKYLKNANMTVIDTNEYYKRYDKVGFAVSSWEGHADEQAHAIWASMMLPLIEKEIQNSKE